ncbi:hypothetical protein JYU10_00485 [bacterium AH-315-J04]|nr:hypothetical protein [bacterium AH-315-J04]
MIGTAHAALPPSAGTDLFLTAQLNRQALIDGERLISLYGAPFATNTADAATFADNFVVNNADAFGIDNCQLQRVSLYTTPSGKYSVASYEQLIDGLPVHGGLVVIPVFLGSPKSINYAGIHLYEHDGSALPVDVITDAADAITIVSQSSQFGHLTHFDLAAEAEKVVYEDWMETLRRTWRFSGWGDGEYWLFFVDTNTGDIVGVEDLIRDFAGDVSGNVSGVGSPCLPPDDSSCPACCAADSIGNPPASLTLPGVELAVFPGQESCPSDTGAASQTQYASSDGTYMLSDVNVGDRVVAYLRNDWLTTVDCGGVLSTVECFDDWQSGLLVDPTPSVCMDIDSSTVDPVDFEFNSTALGCADELPAPTCDDFEFPIALVNGYLGMQKTNNWLRSLAPNFPGIDDPVVCLTNAIATLGYHFTPDYVYFGRRTPAQNNTAFAAPITHEYGHILVQKLRRRISSAATEANLSFEEGMSDLIASLVWNGPTIGKDILGDGLIGRDVDEPDWPLDGCAGTGPNNTGPPIGWASFSTCGTHTKGLAIAGAFWDIRKELLYCEGGETLCPIGNECGVGEVCRNGVCGVACTEVNESTDCDTTNTGEYCMSGLCRKLCTEATVDADCSVGQTCSDRLLEELFIDFWFITDGVLDESVLIEVLIADDDDGDLTNGTPNEDAIEASFIGLHGWAPQDCQNDGTITVKWLGPSGSPVEGVDYFVHNSVCPPLITLRTTEVLEGQIVRPVIRWSIGRTNNGLPADIGNVVADWYVSGIPQDIIIRVGDELDTEIQCRNVGVIEIPRQGNNNFSNIQLDLEGNVIRARCFANDAKQGGRINGVALGSVERVFAEAVGLQATNPGTLASTDIVRRIELQTLPSGSNMTCKGIERTVQIHDTLHGTITIADPDPTEVAQLGLDGTGLSLQVISVDGTGPSTGNIHIDGDITERGQIIIQGDMSGDILANLVDTGDGIEGDVTVNGEFTGNICANNLATGQPLPSNIKLKFGPGATICGAPPVPATPSTVTGEAGYTKDRYISFDPGFGRSAIRVSRQGGPDAWVGCEGTEFCAGCASGFKLVEDIEFCDWQDPVIHVTGCQVKPGYDYTIVATADGVTLTASIVVETTPIPVAPDGFGDLVSSLNAGGTQWGPADGYLTANDILVVIKGFQKDTQVPLLARVDIDGKTPNHIISATDISAAILGFKLTPYLEKWECCDMTGYPDCPPPPITGGSPSTFSLVASASPINPTETVSIDVFIDATSDLTGYEVAINMAAWGLGSLDLQSMSIDENRSDYVFSGTSTITAIDNVTGRIAVVTDDGSSVSVAGSGYLGTFNYLASADADGLFNAVVGQGERAFLLDSNIGKIPTNQGDSILIGVDVLCVDDASCDDSNPCTDDSCDPQVGCANVDDDTNNCDDGNLCTSNACVSGVCQTTNLSAGTSCDDSQACTGVDTCDGAGVCDHTGNTCKVLQVCTECPGNNYCCATPPLLCACPAIPAQY